MSSEYRVRNSIGYPTIVAQASGLSQDMRGKVVETLDAMQEAFGPDQAVYVQSSVLKKLNSTDHDSTMWVRDLSQGFRRLFEYYRQIPSLESQRGNMRWKLVGATLSYFVDPFGVVPDYIAPDGYVDDAFAFYYCVRQLPDDWDSRDEPLSEYLSAQ